MQAAATPSEANSLPEVFHVSDHFRWLNMQLRILSSVLLIEIVHHLSKELKYRKEFLLNRYRKCLQSSLWGCRTCVGRLITEVTNQLCKVLRSRIHKAAEHTIVVGINWNELTDTNS